MTMFVPAVRAHKRARVVISGPSGSGKTRAALALATGLAEHGTAVIDTENRSSELYADRFSFHVAHLTPPFAPARYLEAMTAADRAEGIDVTVVDSGSHAWAGDGGVLAMADEARARSKNKFAAWAQPTAAHNSFLTGIVFAANHVVVTLRSRMKYVQDPDSGEIERVGMVPIQRGEFEYEFDLHLDLGLDHTATVAKSRLDGFPVGSVLAEVTSDHGELLRVELAGETSAVLDVLNPYMVRAHGRLPLAAKLWVMDQADGDGDDRKAEARRLWAAAVETAGLDPDVDELTTADIVAVIGVVSEGGPQ